MALKIYTKTGDKGTTSLIGGTKVSKSHVRIESYGTVDELNSWIGVVSDHLNDPATKTMLKEVQDRLFTIGSSLATDPEKDPKFSLPDLHEEDVIGLEKEIDRMTEQLPEMKSFVLPGGAPAVSFAHVARCVCRRAERLCVAMQEADLGIEPMVTQYLNRLSDYLFVVARYTGHLQKAAEVKWTARI